MANKQAEYKGQTINKHASREIPVGRSKQTEYEDHKAVWNQHLHWPREDVGKRKRKAEVEKQIYAITSKRWMELQAKKIAAKKMKE